MFKEPSEILTDLLTRYPESRKTDNIYKVIEWMMKYYGAITSDGKWDSTKYKEMPSISSLYRRLIEIKKENNWLDDKAMKREIEEREKFNGKTSVSATQVPKASQNANSEQIRPIGNQVDIARKAFLDYQKNKEYQEFKKEVGDVSVDTNDNSVWLEANMIDPNNLTK